MSEPDETLREAIHDELYQLAYDRRALPVLSSNLAPGLVVIDLDRAAANLTWLVSAKPHLFKT